MERQNLRTANASMQVLARDKSVDRGIGAVPADPTQGLAESRKDLCFKVMFLALFLWTGHQLDAWQSCPATGPGPLRSSLWELMILGGKG